MSKYETEIYAIGSQGNIFVVMGTACRYLKQLRAPTAEIDDLRKRVMASDSYSSALGVIREWFPVVTDERS